MAVFVSGFIFFRNIVAMDYSVVEAISAILPIVDEFIVNISPDEDERTDVIASINDSKIKIVRSQWNPNLAQGGYVWLLLRMCVGILGGQACQVRGSRPGRMSFRCDNPSPCKDMLTTTGWKAYRSVNSISGPTMKH